MAKIGSLYVDLQAKTARLKSDFGKANGIVGGFKTKTRKAMRSVADSIFSLRGAITTLIGGAGFGALIKVGIDAADNIGKLTERLGGSTEAWSQLEHVAKLSGVTFESMTMGLQRMTRRVAEAAKGTGEATGALKELRLDAQALSELPLDKQFEVIADSLSNVKAQGDRVRLAMKLFDSEGVSLLQTMKNGSAGIREMRDEANRLGLTLSGDMVEQATKAKDAMTGLGAVMSGVSRSMAISMSPNIILIAEGFRDYLIPFASAALDKFVKFGRYLGGFSAAMEQFITGDFKGAAETITSAMDDLFREPEMQPLKVLGEVQGQTVAMLKETTRVYDVELAKQLEIVKTSYDEKQVTLTESLLNQQFVIEQSLQNELLTYQQYYGLLGKIEEKKTKDRINRERYASNAINSMRQSVVGNAIGLLQVFASKSKAAAIATIVLQKGLAIAQTIMNTQVAAMRALAELGPIAGSAAAAKIQVLGKVSVGLIAATGLAQASQVGGGGAGVGTAANPVVTQEQPLSTTAQSQSVQRYEVYVSVDWGNGTPDQIDQLAKSLGKNIRDGGTDPFNS